MSLLIDDLSTYLSSIEAISSVTGHASTQTTTAQADATGSTDKDSYVSTLGDSSAVLLSDTYNDILDVMKTYQSSSNSSESDSESSSSEAAETTTETTAAAGSASGSSGSSDSEETTETEIVNINGVTYLQTTTTSNGVETITRVPISETGTVPKETPVHEPDGTF